MISETLATVLILVAVVATWPTAFVCGAIWSSKQDARQKMTEAEIQRLIEEWEAKHSMKEIEPE